MTITMTTITKTIGIASIKEEKCKQISYHVDKKKFENRKTKVRILNITAQV